MIKIWMLVVLAVAGCGKKADTPAAGGKRGSGGGKLQYPVEVAPLEVRQMQYSVNAPGSIDAFQQVQITARVAGAVDKVSFTEGQNVKEGEPLVTIESERYTIAVNQAKSAIAKAQATQKSAQAALDRRLEAQKESPGLVPGEEIEQKQTAVDTAKADVDAAHQALSVANLNLRDSTVRAPIAGVVQTRTVQQGQYLQPGAVLATILQRDPLLLRFQVTEQDAPRLKPGMIATIKLRESAHEFGAKITLVNGAADPATRLVGVTAQVDETTHVYWLRPGAFCQVTVPVGDARQGIVVPGLAIQPTEKGNIVYLVDDKNIAHATVVETGMHTAEGGVEVTRGLKAGELLVVRGIEPLSDGAPVKISKQETMAEAEVGAGSGSDAGSGAGSADIPPPVPQGSDTPPAPAAESAAGSGSGSGHHHRKTAAP
ncbi:MAG: efflux RND transporter periplasmic adaptor subunit [Kofleriaceae bacterium]